MVVLKSKIKINLVTNFKRAFNTNYGTKKSNSNKFVKYKFKILVYKITQKHIIKIISY